MPDFFFNSLMQKARKTVKAFKISKALDTSASTVLTTLFRLQRDSLVVVDPKKQIRLTEEGTVLAITLLRQRLLAEKLLCDKLGQGWCSPPQRRKRRRGWFAPPATTGVMVTAKRAGAFKASQNPFSSDFLFF